MKKNIVIFVFIVFLLKFFIGQQETDIVKSHNVLLENIKNRYNVSDEVSSNKLWLYDNISNDKNSVNLNNTDDERVIMFEFSELSTTIITKLGLLIQIKGVFYVDDDSLLKKRMGSAQITAFNTLKDKTPLEKSKEDLVNKVLEKYVQKNEEIKIIHTKNSEFIKYIEENKISKDPWDSRFNPINYISLNNDHRGLDGINFAFECHRIGLCEGAFFDKTHSVYMTYQFWVDWAKIDDELEGIVQIQKELEEAIAKYYRG